MLKRSSLAAATSRTSPTCMRVMASRMTASSMCSFPTMTISAIRHSAWLDSSAAAERGKTAPVAASRSAAKTAISFRLRPMEPLPPLAVPKKDPLQGRNHTCRAVACCTVRCPQRGILPTGRCKSSQLWLGLPLPARVFGRVYTRAALLAGPSRLPRLIFRGLVSIRPRFLASLLFPGRRLLSGSAGFTVVRQDKQLKRSRAEDDVIGRHRRHHPLRQLVTIGPAVIAVVGTGAFGTFPGQPVALGALLLAVIGLGPRGPSVPGRVEFRHDLVVALPAHELLDKPAQILDVFAQ